MLRNGPEKRLYGTAASLAVSILGGAHLVRVHDVAEMAQVARMTDAILNEEADYDDQRSSTPTPFLDAERKSIQRSY